jgi:hypothetical protein
MHACVGMRCFLAFCSAAKTRAAVAEQCHCKDGRPAAPLAPSPSPPRDSRAQSSIVDKRATNGKHERALDDASSASSASGSSPSHASALPPQTRRPRPQGGPQGVPIGVPQAVPTPTKPQSQAQSLTQADDLHVPDTPVCTLHIAHCACSESGIDFRAAQFIPTTNGLYRRRRRRPRL